MIEKPAVMVNRTTQTGREMWKLDESEESVFSEDIDLNEFELDPGYAKGLIDAVLECFSDTASEHVA